MRYSEGLNPVRTASESCAKVRDLGFTASMQMNMYGERFQIVSEPFDEGGCVSVHATCGSDPEIRTLRLPIAILLGLGLKKKENRDEYK